MYQICWTVSLGYIWDLVTYGVVFIRSVEEYRLDTFEIWLHTVLYVSDLLNSIGVVVSDTFKDLRFG